MTFLEKLKEDHSGREKWWYEKQVEAFCPCEYGYTKETSDDCEYNGWNTDVCLKCWNREMIDTEEKEDEPLKDFTDDLLNQGYSKGILDGWNLVARINKYSYEKIGEIFDSGRLQYVLENFTPQEALAKLNKYEEVRAIKVGDVVELIGSYGVVTNIDEKDEELDVLWSGGNTNIVQFDAPIGLKKTGKHIDIQSILEQIGE